MFPKKLESRLQERQAIGNLRHLPLNRATIDFYSNDYLGLRQNSELLAMLPQKKTMGSGGSRLLSGNTENMLQIEAQLALYYNDESALFFPSGYTANVGLFSCLGTKEDTIIYDQHIHASAREGIRLSVARSYSFIHNDYEDLEKKIKNASGDIYVAIEGIYSMHGDIPDKKALIALQKKYGFYLIVDEAHSVGILGEKGKGWSEEIDRSSLFAKVITFGKAFGFHGALVTGNAKLKEYLINFSKPFIYTTAPAENAFETVAIIHDYFSRYQNELRKKLLENITHYNKARNESLVSPIKIVENREIENIYSHLQKANIQCKIIRPPTVEKDREIIRICLHNFNTREEVKLLTNIIENV